MEKVAKQETPETDKLFNTTEAYRLIMFRGIIAIWRADCTEPWPDVGIVTAAGTYTYRYTLMAQDKK
jgi:hypothetical protein